MEDPASSKLPSILLGGGVKVCDSFKLDRVEAISWFIPRLPALSRGFALTGSLSSDFFVESLLWLLTFNSKVSEPQGDAWLPNGSHSYWLGDVDDTRSGCDEVFLWKGLFCRREKDLVCASFAPYSAVGCDEDLFNKDFKVAPNLRFDVFISPSSFTVKLLCKLSFLLCVVFVFPVSAFVTDCIWFESLVFVFLILSNFGNVSSGSVLFLLSKGLRSFPQNKSSQTAWDDELWQLLFDEIDELSWSM